MVFIVFQRPANLNALGTVYVNQEFSKRMHKGSVIVDIASMSAYTLPEAMLPKAAYALAETDEAAFVDALLKICAVVEDAYKKNGLAYSLSKNFVTWYAAKCAFDFGPNGIRVASLSPGLIATDPWASIPFSLYAASPRFKDSSLLQLNTTVAPASA